MIPKYEQVPLKGSTPILLTLPESYTAFSPPPPHPWKQFLKKMMKPLKPKDVHTVKLLTHNCLFVSNGNRDRIRKKSSIICTGAELMKIFAIVKIL